MGVQTDERATAGARHVIEYFAVGTAVIPTKADHTIAAPNLIMGMDD